MFDDIINTENRVENTTRRGVFDELRGVYKDEQTLSRVFDISSQSKLNLRRKRGKKIVKIYAYSVTVILDEIKNIVSGICGM